jgi:hypothetical protein
MIFEAKVHKGLQHLRRRRRRIRRINIKDLK